jgi:FkbM family methyltransferase
MSTGPVEATLRRAVIGTRLESYARFIWKRVLRRKTKNDVYDAQTAEIMRRLLRPDSNCVDIGCHEGSFLDQMLELSPRGIHHAFEPLPDMASALVRKYARLSNVVVHAMAVSNAAGTITFHANQDHPGMSGIERRDYASEADRVQLIQVRTDRLDAVIPAAHRIDFLKVDVEGAEYLVFDGAREHLSRDRPVVVFEHGDTARKYYGAGSTAVFDVLAECGLKVSLLEQFLGSGPTLTRDELVHQVEDGLNFYFVAHP